MKLYHVVVKGVEVAESDRRASQIVNQVAQQAQAVEGRVEVVAPGFGTQYAVIVVEVPDTAEFHLEGVADVEVREVQL